MHSGGTVVESFRLAAFAFLAILIAAAVAHSPAGVHAFAETTRYGLQSGGCRLASYAINPLAAYGSPAGMFLAGILVQGADSAEHMGIPRRSGEPFRTKVGQALDSLHGATIPHAHPHGDEHAACGGHCRPDRFQRANADRLISQRLRRAYLLDPTHPQVFQPLIHHIMGGETPVARQDLHDLITHANAALRTRSGRWPEHSLQAAANAWTRWVVDETPRAAIPGLLAEIRLHLATARAQHERLRATGAWDRRDPWQREEFDESARYLENFAAQLAPAVVGGSNLSSVP